MPPLWHCESMVVFSDWITVRGVDTVWTETIRAQRLDTDVDWDTQVHILQNTLQEKKQYMNYYY